MCNSAALHANGEAICGADMLLTSAGIGMAPPMGMGAVTPGGRKML